MKKAVIGVIGFFCALLVTVWILSERAHPAMINVDPAHQRHH